MAADTELLSGQEFELVDDKDTAGGGFGGDGWTLGESATGKDPAELAPEKEEEKKAPEEGKNQKTDEGKKDAPAALDTAALQAILDNQAKTFKTILDTEATRSQEAIGRLEKRIETLAKVTPADKGKQSAEEEALVLPTDEEWRADENKAAEKAFRFYRSQERKEERKIKAEEQARESEAQKELAEVKGKETLKAEQNKAWAAAVQFEPALAEESADPNHVRNLTASILYSEETGLKGNPKGPFIAAMMAISLAKRITDGKGAVDGKLEESRQLRLKSGQMGGGKEGAGKGGRGEDQLDAQDLAIIKMMGVSEATYKESRKQVGGM